MLVDIDNFEDLAQMRREIKRLNNVIVASLARRKELKEKTEQLWDQIEQGQRRLPFDEAEHVETSPAVNEPTAPSNGSGNGHRGRRKGHAAEAHP